MRYSKQAYDFGYGVGLAFDADARYQGYILAERSPGKYVVYTPLGKQLSDNELSLSAAKKLIEYYKKNPSDPNVFRRS